VSVPTFLVGEGAEARLTYDCPTCPPPRVVRVEEPLRGRSVAAADAEIQGDPACCYCRRDRGELRLVGYRFVRAAARAG
jgi:hypothetical protein